jgi:hypothetical protein
MGYFIGKRSEAREESLRKWRRRPRALADRPKRWGALSKAEKAHIAAIVADAPRELGAEQIEVLADAMRRTPETIKRAVANAREEVQERASRYGEIHLAAVEGALAAGDHETAAKESRQMLERVTDDEGKRVIGVAEDAKGAQGVNVLINIPLGGVKAAQD